MQSGPCLYYLRFDIQYNMQCNCYRELAWDEKLTSTLVNLAPKHKPGSGTRFRKVTDQRFTYNGFDIRIENDTERALLYGICSSVISFIGVTDVHEIIKEIIKNSDVAIEDCRPQKVKTVSIHSNMIAGLSVDKKFAIRKKPKLS